MDTKTQNVRSGSYRSQYIIGGCLLFSNVEVVDGFYNQISVVYSISPNIYNRWMAITPTAEVVDGYYTQNIEVVDGYYSHCNLIHLM